MEERKWCLWDGVIGLFERIVFEFYLELFVNIERFEWLLIELEMWKEDRMLVLEINLVVDEVIVVN